MSVYVCDIFFIHLRMSMLRQEQFFMYWHLLADLRQLSGC